MSGIYIGWMELPEGTDCLDIKIYRNGDIYVRNTGYGGWRATPVPDHGRLIDADVLSEKHKELAYELRGKNYDFHMTAKAWVDNAQTIIPADKE